MFAHFCTPSASAQKVAFIMSDAGKNKFGHRSMEDCWWCYLLKASQLSECAPPSRTAWLMLGWFGLFKKLHCGWVKAQIPCFDVVSVTSWYPKPTTKNLLEGLAPAIRLLSSMCPEEPSVPQLFTWASAVLSMDDAWDNGDWWIIFCCKRCFVLLFLVFFVDSEGFFEKFRWKWLNTDFSAIFLQIIHSSCGDFKIPYLSESRTQS